MQKSRYIYFLKNSVLAISLLIAVNSYSQKQTTIDSLTKLLNISEDSAKVAILKLLSWEHRNSDTSKAILLGHIAFEKATELDLKFEQADILGRLGVYQRNKGNFSKAMDFYFKGLDIAEKHNFLKLEAIEYNNIGDIYNRLGIYDQATDYVHKALQISASMNDEYNLAYIHHMLGQIYMNNSKLDSAFISFRKSLYYRKHLNIKAGIGSSYMNIGMIHFKKANYDSSIIYYNRSLEIFQSINDRTGAANVYKCLGEYYNQKGEFKKAIELFRQSMILIKGFGLPQVNKEAAEGLKSSYSKLGDFRQALYYQEYATKIKDSISNNIFIQKITRLTENHKFEIRSKEQEIISKQKEEILRERIKNQRTQLNLFIIGFLLMVVLISITIFFYQGKNKAFKALNQKKIEIEELNKGLTSANIKIKLQKEEIETQRDNLQIQSNNLANLNATKDKLFSIIGHDLRSPFNSIIGFSEYINENRHNLSIEKIHQMNVQINEVGINTLGILDNLLNWAQAQTHQVNVNKESISISSIINNNLNAFIPQANSKKIKLVYQMNNDLNVFVDQNIVNTLFRNLISNSIKYSKLNGVIIISVKQYDKQVEVSIQDNGIGISDEIKNELFTSNVNPSQVGTANEKGTGLGLAICNEFIKKLDGRIWVESETGKGSTFKFTLPLS